LKNKYFVFFLFLHLTRAVCVGQIPQDKKQAVAVNPASITKLLDSLFAKYNNNTSPGLAITIIQNGTTIVKKNYGMASIEFKVPFAHNTVVSIPYSEGREFIAVATALLEQDKKLKLEDKVKNYFPKLPVWADAVTIQDLLNHSSGFCDEWATLVLTQADMSNRFDVSQFLDFLYRQPEPQVEPGKGYMYSNSDFGLLRLILEKASGEKLPDYMQQRIFTPLKMYNSGMRRDKEDVIPNHAFSYEDEGEGIYSVWLRDKTSAGGNYQVLTTANDLEKWAEACANKNSFITKAFNRLKENGRPIPVLKETSYVFGHKEKNIGNYKMTAHEGVTGFNYLSQVEEAGLTVIFLGNIRGSWTETIATITDHLLHNRNTKRQAFTKFPSAPINIDKTRLQQYAGRYAWTEPTFQSNTSINNYTEFRVIDDSLNWVYNEQDIFPVVPVGEGIFKDPGFPIWMVFEQPHPDSLMRLTMHAQTNKPQIVESIRDTATARYFSKATMQQLTGKYYNKHLDFYWTIEMDNKGRLLVKRPTISDKYLEPQPGGEFRMNVQYYTDQESSVYIKFYFDEAGNPAYFDVHHARLMHCRFDKQ